MLPPLRLARRHARPRARDPLDTAAARRLLGEALRFVRHHGENEDVLLLPLLRSRAPEIVLEHMREEEQDLEIGIRAVLTADDLASFSRGSVERTAPADQRMMLGWMLPAMPRAEAEAFLKRLPPAVAEELSRLIEPDPS